jgi:hypothetical protein
MVPPRGTVGVGTKARQSATPSLTGPRRAALGGKRADLFRRGPGSVDGRRRHPRPRPRSAEGPDGQQSETADEPPPEQTQSRPGGGHVGPVADDLGVRRSKHSTNPWVHVRAAALRPSDTPHAGSSPSYAARALGVSVFRPVGVDSRGRLNTSRGYAKGATPASSQLARMLEMVAAALAPPVDPANSQFLRPTTGPPSSRSLGLLLPWISESRCAAHPCELSREPEPEVQRGCVTGHACSAKP